MDPLDRAGPKRATNVSLNEGLLVEAKALGVNVSSACEQGLADAVRQQRARRWQEENAAAFDAWNTYVEDHGVPLGEYRKF
jgi:antitoxin CcdA